MNYSIFKSLFVLTICSTMICGHKIDQDCIETLSVDESSRGIELPYVTVKIVRVNLPFPLKEMFVPEEELVTLVPGVLVNITFDGDESHSQVYNPRELFLYFDGSHVLAAMGTYSYFNYSGTSFDSFGCISWSLEVADYLNKTDSKVYGEEFSERKVQNISIPVYTRDIIRLEILDLTKPNGPSYDNECAFLGQFVRSTDQVTDNNEQKFAGRMWSADHMSDTSGLHLSMRHVQVRYNVAGNEETNIVKTLQISNLTESSTQVFQFEIPPMSQMPESIQVPRNLSVTNNGDGNVTLSIAFMEYFTKPVWVCNIEKISSEDNYQTKLYFSHYQGVSSEGEYRNIVDYIEFNYENAGNTIRGLKALPMTVLLLIFTIVKQSYLR